MGGGAGAGGGDEPVARLPEVACEWIFVEGGIYCCTGSPSGRRVGSMLPGKKCVTVRAINRRNEDKPVKSTPSQYKGSSENLPIGLSDGTGSCC